MSELHPFQRRAHEQLAKGESIIIQAPTGAGKTRAALAPFIQHLANPDAFEFSLTCRYSVPLRVLTQQFFAEYKDIAQRLDARNQTELENTFRAFDKPAIARQTGEQADDPHFEAALDFCTIDQTLASFLGIPYGVGRKAANINPGAFLGSYLVFDEFHLYPIAEERASVLGARTTTLRMLELLRQGGERLSPFTMMTATFSTSLLKRLARMLGATIVSVLPDADNQAQEHELTAINAGRQRIYHLHDQPMSAEQILAQHDRCSLVICNTIKRAQQLYLDIKRQARDETQVLLLHSRFTDEDRQKKQTYLAERLNKAAWLDVIQKAGGPPGDLIVVATQVVEVGLDISVLNLHTDIAPANSLIQRAGRCARFPRQQGSVHIYPLADAEQANAYLPYSAADCQATWAACQTFAGRHVGFFEEQAIIDAVHTAADEGLLIRFEEQRPAIDRLITSGWGDGERAIASQLIRNVDQISFIIHDDPNDVITTSPWRYQTFGIRPTSLYGMWPRLLEAANHLSTTDWVQADDHQTIAWISQLVGSDELTENERAEPHYTWRSVQKPQELAMGLVAALAPYVVAYTETLGVVFRDGSLPEIEANWPEDFRSQPRPGPARPFQKQEYKQETYREHIQGLFRAYQHSRLMDELGYAAARLERLLRLPAGAIDQAIRLAIACHDIGKLGQKWQQWCEEWQNQLVRTYPDRAEWFIPTKRPFAHTDYDGSRDWTLQKGLARRPPHACESAYLAGVLIEDSLGVRAAAGEQSALSLAKATIAAIARHHFSFSSEYQAIKLIASARETVAEVLREVRQSQSWSFDIDLLDTAIQTQTGEKLSRNEMTIIPPDASFTSATLAEAWCYFILVRALRLCDWRSFRYRQDLD